MIGWVFGLVGNLLLLVAWIVAWIGALSGQEKKIPVITDLAMKFDF